MTIRNRSLRRPVGTILALAIAGAVTVSATAFGGPDGRPARRTGIPGPVAAASQAETEGTVEIRADATVDEKRPDATLGDKQQLRADVRPERRSYLKFRLPDIGGTLTEATIRIWVRRNPGGFGVAVVTGKWSEPKITYDNAPPVGSPYATFEPGPEGGWVSIPVPLEAVTDGVASVAIVGVTRDFAEFASGEAKRPAVMHYTFTVPEPSPSPSPTTSPDGDPTVVAAGDIACDPSDSHFNGGAGTATWCHMRQTSDLIASLAPTAVLALGDNQYEEGTLQQFRASYDPTWGRFRSITFPVPGNHEYQTPGAAGYFDYFGARAGDPDKGYYSFDIAAWHIVALNSECGPVGGCGPSSPQVAWLRDDLAASDATCTLAYFHRPRFSSGTEHGNDASMATFWEVLYAAGADVVLSGHEHNYERFRPQDPSQQADPQGIREFVVGTGGKVLYDLPSKLEPNSVAQNDTTFGVLELTLHETSYDWRFVPEAGGSYSDSGSTVCSP